MKPTDKEIAAYERDLQDASLAVVRTLKNYAGLGTAPLYMAIALYDALLLQTELGRAPTLEEVLAKSKSQKVVSTTKYALVLLRLLNEIETR